MKELAEEEMADNKTKSGLWTPQVIIGGKDGGGSTPSSNWLLGLEMGAIFLCLEKQKYNNLHFLQEEYWLLAKTEKSAKLHYEDHRGTGFLWVNADRFVEQKDLVEVLGHRDVD